MSLKPHLCHEVGFKLLTTALLGIKVSIVCRFKQFLFLGQLNGTRICSPCARRERACCNTSVHAFVCPSYYSRRLCDSCDTSVHAFVFPSYYSRRLCDSCNTCTRILVQLNIDCKLYWCFSLGYRVACSMEERIFYILL